MELDLWNNLDTDPKNRLKREQLKKKIKLLAVEIVEGREGGQPSSLSLSVSMSSLDSPQGQPASWGGLFGFGDDTTSDFGREHQRASVD